MEWRPKDWSNPHKTHVNDQDYKVGDIYAHDAYEAGADAIMLALWAMAKQSPTGKFTLDSTERIIQ